MNDTGEIAIRQALRQNIFRAVTVIVDGYHEKLHRQFQGFGADSLDVIGRKLAFVNARLDDDVVGLRPWASWTGTQVTDALLARIEELVPDANSVVRHLLVDLLDLGDSALVEMIGRHYLPEAGDVDVSGE